MRLGRRKFVNLTSGSLGTAVLFGCGDGGLQEGSSGSSDGSSSSDGSTGGSSSDADMSEGGDESTGGTGSSPDPGPMDIPDLPGGTPASVGTSSREELDLDLSVLAGKLPSDMLGHYFMVCAMPWRDGTMLVNGDGMVFRLDFGDDAVHLRSRLVKTPCYYAEKAVAGTDDAFDNPGGGPARISGTLGARNQCNTALVPLSNDRILATFDGGRPFELDPVTLEVVTAVGYHREWKAGLDFSAIPGNFIGSVFPLVFSTAHPNFDPNTGEFFSVNYGSGAGIEILGNQLLGEIFTRVIRWDGQGSLQHWNLVDESGQPVKIIQSAHQMQVTERYVVIQDSAFRIEPGQLFDPQTFETQLQQTVLWVVRRADLDQATPGSDVLARRFTFARESPHFMADYENPGGRLTVHVVHNNAYDASEWLKEGDRLYVGGGPVRPDLHGMLNTTTDLNHVGRYVIDVEARRVLPDQTRLMKDDDLTWAITLLSITLPFLFFRVSAWTWRRLSLRHEPCQSTNGYKAHRSKLSI